MRSIKYIVVHCTATRQSTSISALLRGFKQRGWRNPGYHYVVMPLGDLRVLLAEGLIANGVKGHNQHSIHIAYMGGIDAQGSAVDNRTAAQRAMLVWALKDLRSRYPEAVILGHRDLSPDLNGDGVITPNEFVKLCPCFNAKEAYKGI